MKYIFLSASIIFGISGISQAMDALKVNGFKEFAVTPLVFKFQYLSVSFTPAPGFVRILILSLGLFILYLIWQKLKELGIGKISDYIL